MNNNGSIAINSDEISSAIGYLSTSCANMEGNVLGMLPGSFTVLSDLGLYSNGIASIQRQANVIIDSHKTLISQIAQHLEDYASKEDRMSSFLDNGVDNFLPGSGGYSGEILTNEDTPVDNVNKGKVINTDYLVNNISKLTSDEMRQMLSILNMNKPDDTTLTKLLLDNSLSSKLYTLLKTIYGDKTEDSTVTVSDYEKVQKCLIDSIFAENLQIQGLDNKSIFSIKEYLANVSEKNNIKVSQLLLDDSYKGTLKSSLLNLYDGNEIDGYNLSATDINNFRSYIDDVAEKNNITYEDLLSDKINLIL